MSANLPPLENTGFWRNRRVLLTGGSGFLGRQIHDRLVKFGAEVFVPRSKEYNFVSMDQTIKCLANFQPEMVIHSAAYYGGLGITMAEPAKIYFENLVMGANLMEASRLADVEKFVGVGTACSYPGELTGEMSEARLWDGRLHDSVIAYGSVKKMMAIQGLAYRRQYGFNAIHVIPANLYGPGDCFDDYRSHVIGALIKKFADAHENRHPVSIWGSGKPVREFLYVEDCADGILLAAEKYNDVEPVNIGTGVGTTIRQLVETIARSLNFNQEIQWDASKPDGQMRKLLDITKMKHALGWSPRMSLEKGIPLTMEWYRNSVRAEKKAA